MWAWGLASKNFVYLLPSNTYDVIRIEPSLGRSLPSQWQLAQIQLDLAGEHTYFYSLLLLLIWWCWGSSPGPLPNLGNQLSYIPTSPTVAFKKIFFFLSIFWHKVLLYSPDWTRIHSVVHPKSVFLLPQSSMCWDYTSVPHLACLHHFPKGE